MKRIVFFLLNLFIVNRCVAQTLQTVTSNGNVTSNFIFITGQNSPPTTGTGIGISYLPSLNLSAIESRSWPSGVYQPLVINGTTVGLSSRVLINGESDDGVAVLQINGAIDNNSALSNNQDRPAVSSGTVQGEIRGISSGWYHGDDGFLRLSAGGGTNTITKSYIDLSGYTNPTSLDRFENIVLGTAGMERVRITSNGNIGIGIANPQSLLSVNGTITGKQVTVTQTGWSDFVFRPAYRLGPLSAVERYIRQNNHLPGIPSTKEVEAKGLNLGKMQQKQMQKIEELTLYAIDQDKRITDQDYQIKTQRQQVAVLNQLVRTQQQTIERQSARLEQQDKMIRELETRMNALEKRLNK